MGIFDGRGRWSRWNTKDLVGNSLRLDAHTLARRVDLARAGGGSWQWSWSTPLGGKRSASISYRTVPDKGIVLDYKHAGQPVPSYLARIVTTVPNYGGRRYWFLCPHCGRRVRYLYSGRLFLCRTCHNLTYATTQAGKGDIQPAIRNKLLQIRRRLQVDGDPLGKFPDKPRYMQMRTYRRLWFEHTALQRLYMDAQNAELLGLVGMIDIAERGELRYQWQRYKRSGQMPPPWLPELRPSPLASPRDEEKAAAERQAEEEAERAYWRWLERDDPRRRLTLGELATAARVPYAFAKEAQAEGLIKPDGGRGTRTHRYRRRLSTWLGKLHRYRAAGLEWEAIREWSRRRWQSGHEHERREPAGLVW
jgi:hypothetical protein